MTLKTDVAVVEAGAAGLAAAKELRSLGVDHVVLEARPVIGGRTVCDETAFGFPYDLGGFWLSTDGGNMLADAARKLGFDTQDTTCPLPDMPMILGSDWETSQKKSARLSYNETAMPAIEWCDTLRT